MNVEVRRCEVVDNRMLVFEFDNGIEMHLVDNSDQYETMSIIFKGGPTLYI